MGERKITFVLPVPQPKRETRNGKQEKSQSNHSFGLQFCE